MASCTLRTVWEAKIRITPLVIAILYKCPSPRLWWDHSVVNLSSTGEICVTSSFSMDDIQCTALLDTAIKYDFVFSPERMTV